MYLATGQAGDAEMTDRIARHRERRGAKWVTIEEPHEIASVMERAPGTFAGVLLDCVTLWLSNLMFAGKDVSQALDALAEVVAKPGLPLVLVSNEVGMGLVPETPLGREFRDLQGIANQRLARACSRVIFVAAGLPLMLKDEK